MPGGSMTSTEVVESQIKREAEESDKENAARSCTYRRDPPTIRQNITSAGVISPIRAPRDDHEMIHRHTSPDAMDIHRGFEDVRMQNRSILRRRRRDLTLIDTTGVDNDEDMDEHGHLHLAFHYQYDLTTLIFPQRTLQYISTNWIIDTATSPLCISLDYLSTQRHLQFTTPPTSLRASDSLAEQLLTAEHMMPTSSDL
ncbi:MAG: hypothetical protein LQ350_004308 [Teloschistes chrysophthalmus]|nr:MAG: hypothetical protein LQ350_004308 [Niorma chrysophthalma]